MINDIFRSFDHHTNSAIFLWLQTINDYFSVYEGNKGGFGGVIARSYTFAKEEAR